MADEETIIADATIDADDAAVQKESLGDYNEIPEFKKLYWQKQDAQRKTKAANERADALEQDVKKLKGLFDSLEDRVDDSEVPPDIDDPAAIVKFATDKATRAVEKKERWTAIEPPPVEKKPAPIAPRWSADAITAMEITERRLNPDFAEVTKAVLEAVQYDDILHTRLFNSDNPPQAFYEYGERLIAAKKDNADYIASQGSLEHSDKGSELPVVNSKYSYKGKPMSEAQVEAWVNNGLPMSKITVKK